MAPDVEPEAARPATLTWSLVIPVKVLAQAKSRLTGLAGQRRSDVALAMAADTVAAAVGAASVAAVLVVTDDPDVSDIASRLGAVVLPDAPGAGLNEALAHGAAYSQRPMARPRPGRPGWRPAGGQAGGADSGAGGGRSARHGVRARCGRNGDDAVRGGAGCAVLAAVRAGITGPAPGDRARSRSELTWPACAGTSTRSRTCVRLRRSGSARTPTRCWHRAAWVSKYWADSPGHFDTHDLDRRDVETTFSVIAA